MSLGDFPACKYAPLMSTEATEKHSIAATERTMRIIGNCAVAESFRTNSLSLSRFPCGTRRHFSFSFPPSPSFLTWKVVGGNHVGMSWKIPIRNFLVCLGLCVVLFLLGYGLIHDPSRSKLEFEFRGGFVPNHFLILLKDLLLRRCKMKREP